jgi:hypothetical protein
MSSSSSAIVPTRNLCRPNFMSTLRLYSTNQDMITIDPSTNLLNCEYRLSITRRYDSLGLPELINPNERLYVPLARRYFDVIGWLPVHTRSFFHFRLILCRLTPSRRRQLILLDVPQEAIAEPPMYYPWRRLDRALDAREEDSGWRCRSDWVGWYGNCRTFWATFSPFCFSLWDYTPFLFLSFFSRDMSFLLFPLTCTCIWLTHTPSHSPFPATPFFLLFLLFCFHFFCRLKMAHNSLLCCP